MMTGRPKKKVSKEKTKEYNRRWYLKHRKEHIKRCMVLYKKKRDVYRAKNYSREQKLRQEAITHYGSKCVHCGEIELVVLTIDHIKDDGAVHRKTLKGKVIFKWLKDNKYPEGFQVLCRNCNWRKWIKYKNSKETFS